MTSAVSTNATAAGAYRNEFPYLSYIAYATNGDISNYDALQATLQGRNYHGLSFLAGYTYSHALSETDNDIEGSNTVVSDKNNLRLNYGNSASDLRHRFTFSPTYNIPGMKSPGQMLQGWAVSGILTLQSGLTWSPNDSSVDYLGTGELGPGYHAAMEFPRASLGVQRHHDSYSMLWGGQRLHCLYVRSLRGHGDTSSLPECRDGSLRRSRHNAGPAGSRRARQ